MTNSILWIWTILHFGSNAYMECVSVFEFMIFFVSISENLLKKNTNSINFSIPKNHNRNTLHWLSQMFRCFMWLFWIEIVITFKVNCRNYATIDKWFFCILNQHGKCPHRWSYFGNVQFKWSELLTGNENRKNKPFFTKMFIPGSKFWSPVKMCTLRTFEVVECMKWLQRWLKFQYFVNNPVNRSFFKRIICCLNIFRKYYVKTMSQLQFKIIREKTVGFDGFAAKLLLIRVHTLFLSIIKA